MERTPPCSPINDIYSKMPPPPMPFCIASEGEDLEGMDVIENLLSSPRNSGVFLPDLETRVTQETQAMLDTPTRPRRHMSAANIIQLRPRFNDSTEIHGMRSNSLQGHQRLGQIFKEIFSNDVNISLPGSPTSVTDESHLRQQQQEPLPYHGAFHLNASHYFSSLENDDELEGLTNRSHSSQQATTQIVDINDDEDPDSINMMTKSLHLHHEHSFFK